MRDMYPFAWRLLRSLCCIAMMFFVAPIAPAHAISFTVDLDSGRHYSSHHRYGNAYYPSYRPRRHDNYYRTVTYYTPPRVEVGYYPDHRGYFRKQRHVYPPFPAVSYREPACRKPYYDGPRYYSPRGRWSHGGYWD